MDWNKLTDEQFAVAAKADPGAALMYSAARYAALSARLGDEMGFHHMTVEPGDSKLRFSAEPVEGWAPPQVAPPPEPVDTESAEFERIIEPVMEFLGKHPNPHTSVVITSTTAEMSFGVRTHSTDKFVLD